MIPECVSKYPKHTKWHRDKAKTTLKKLRSLKFAGSSLQFGPRLDSGCGNGSTCVRTAYNLYLSSYDVGGHQRMCYMCGSACNGCPSCDASCVIVCDYYAPST